MLLTMVSYAWLLSSHIPQNFAGYNNEPRRGLESRALQGPAAKFADQKEYGLALFKEGVKYLKTPYKWGGNDLRRGIDCSHFIAALVKQVGGLSIPAPVHYQETKGEIVIVAKNLKRFHRGADEFDAAGLPTDVGSIAPGDRLIRQVGTKKHETAIYVGDVVHGKKQLKSMLLLARSDGGVQLLPLSKFAYTFVLRDW